MEFIKRTPNSTGWVRLVIIGLLLAFLGIYVYNTVYVTEEMKDIADLQKREPDIEVSQSQSVLRNSRLKTSSAFRPRYNMTSVPGNTECPRDRLLAPYIKAAHLPKWPVYLPNYRSPCFQDSNGPKCLPYVHILGVAKSGTSMLAVQLKRHPDILESGIREETFLGNPAFKFQEFVKDFELATSVIDSDINDEGYHPKIAVQANPTLFSCQFHTWPGKESPACTLAHTVHAIFPEARLLVCMRDPKMRLLSHFRQETTKQHRHVMHSPQLFHENVIKAIAAMNACLKENTLRRCAFDQPLQRQLNGYHVNLLMSLYYPYAAEWLSAFPSENIYFIKAEEFYQHGREIMADVFRFLELDTSEVLMDTIDISTSSTYQEGLEFDKSNTSFHNHLWDSTAKLLDDFYAPFNRQLATLLGDDKWLFKSS